MKNIYACILGSFSALFEYEPLSWRRLVLEQKWLKMLSYWMNLHTYSVVGALLNLICTLRKCWGSFSTLFEKKYVNSSLLIIEHNVWIFWPMGMRWVHKKSIHSGVKHKAICWVTFNSQPIIELHTGIAQSDCQTPWASCLPCHLYALPYLQVRWIWWCVELELGALFAVSPARLKNVVQTVRYII